MQYSTLLTKRIIHVALALGLGLLTTLTSTGTVIFVETFLHKLVTFEDNYFEGSKAAGSGAIHLDGNHNAKIAHNISSGPSGYAAYAEASAANVLAEYNNQTDLSYSGVQVGAGNISADLLFVDAAGGDYQLQSGSPCIDAGHPGSQYLDDDGGGFPAVGAAHVNSWTKGTVTIPAANLTSDWVIIRLTAVSGTGGTTVVVWDQITLAVPQVCNAERGRERRGCGSMGVWECGRGTCSPPVDEPPQAGKRFRFVVSTQPDSVSGVFQFRERLQGL